MNQSDNLNEPPGTNSNRVPGISQVYDHMLFGLSIPERALRTTSAMVGGVIRESTSLLIPQAFQDSKSYRMFVTQMLDFVSSDIGGVKQKKPSSTNVEGYVAKKAVSNFIELAGLATLHVSPLTVLAIVSDLAYGSNSFLKELSIELKKQGVIAEDSTIDSTADLLSSISDTTGRTASVFDQPPLSVDGLKKTVADTQESLRNIDPTKLLPQKELERIWGDIQKTANENAIDVFQVGAAMSLYSLNQLGTVVNGALTTVRVSGNMFDAHIIEHYRKSLSSIHERGFYQSLADSSRPYFDAMWFNFSSARPTITEDLLNGTLLTKAWRGVTGWFRSPSNSAVPSTADSSPNESEANL